MASDAHLENTVSVMAHKALGFEESSRTVHFRKWLTVASERTADQSSTARPLALLVLDCTFAVCRLANDAAVSSWATASVLFSITRTADELSVVCRQDAVPEAIPCERGWRCLRVVGTIPFSVVGVLASLTAPLAKARISVFALSTFDTDYLFVRQNDLAAALAVLRQQGHAIGQ
jgi:hypothetical protein